MQNLVVLVLFSIEIMTVKAGHNCFATHINAYKAKLSVQKMSALNQDI